MEITAILTLLGSLANPISQIWQSENQKKLAKISAGTLDEQLRLAQAANDTELIKLTQETIKLKQEQEKQATNQKAIVGGVIVAVFAGLLYAILKVFASPKKPSISVSGK